MDPLAQAVSSIIKEQRSIVGPLALDQAKKVEGLEIDDSNKVQITGNKKDVLDKLVNQFAKLFGQASVEVCKTAFAPFADKISPSEIPDVLKT